MALTDHSTFGEPSDLLPQSEVRDDESHEPFHEALVDQLAAEIVASLRRGERPETAALADRFPELADSIEDYVRALTLLEESSSQRHGPTLSVRTGDPFCRQLGDFRLLRELGRGGMGIVYEAEQVSLNRRVAIKILPRSPLFTERTRTRFAREATAAGRLHHSNIVPVFGIGEQDGLRYFVMQRIHGAGLDLVIPEAKRLLEGGRPGQDDAETLSAAPVGHQAAVAAASWLVSFAAQNPVDGASRRAGETNEVASNRPLAKKPSRRSGPAGAALLAGYWKNVARIGLQAAEALAYAHSHEVLHRDLKPANMLLDEQGRLWLADFGLAKLLEDEALTESGVLIGTIRYSPPETFRGEYDTRSDLYQLGLTLYELLTFRPAVQAVNRQQAIDMVLRERPESPRKIFPQIPRDLETIVMKCLAYEPDGRYASADALAGDLRRFLQERPILARRVGPIERTWRWCRRNRAVAALAGLSASMLVLIAAVSSWSFLREARLRQEADRTTRTALSALDHVYDAFVPSWSNIGEAAESGSLTASPEVAQLLEELVQFYDQLAGETSRRSDAQSSLDGVSALRRIGQIHVRLRNFEKAKETYGRAVQRLGRMYAENDPEVVLERARVFNDLGFVYWANRQIEESYESHMIAQGLLNRRNAQGALPADDDWQFELARTWYLLGRQARGRFGGVPLRPVITLSAEMFDRDYRTPRREAELDQAVNLLEPLATRTGNPEHRHLLAVCYRERCDPLLTTDGTPVDPTILRAISILEELVQDYPKHLGYRYSLCLAYHWYHVPLKNGKKALAAGLKRSDRALRIAEELAHEAPQEWIFRAAQVDINLQTSKFMTSYGYRTESLERCRRAVDLLSHLYDQHPTPAFCYWLGHAQLILAESSMKLDLYDAVLEHTDRSLDLLNHAFTMHPEWAHVVYLDLRRVMGCRATALRRLNRPEEAALAQNEAEEYGKLHQQARTLTK